MSDGERRQVTVIFSDLANFTGIAESLDEEDVYNFIRYLTTEQERIIEKHGGVVQEFAGDGLMAIFGAPAALEDAPLRACRAALEIQDFFHSNRQAILNDYGAPAELRIGINSGTAIIGKMGESQAAASSALGDSINVAARLQALANPGAVVLSTTTHELVAPFVNASVLGTFALKGKVHPEVVHRLDGLRKGAARFDASRRKGLTALVGRDSELASMMEIWQRTATGKTRLLGIVGEAGIGKSRLLHEFISLLGDCPVAIFAGHCQADAEIPYGPFIEVIQSLFGIRDEVANEVAIQQLRKRWTEMGISDEYLPYIASLLGLGEEREADQTNVVPPEVTGLQTLRAIVAMVDCKCTECPMVLILEDLHWMDGASLAALTALESLGGSARLLIIATSRPEGRGQLEALGASNMIELSALSAHQIDELLKARFQTTHIPDELSRLIVSRSDGNPLFAEELAVYLVNKGAVTRTEEGVRLESKFDAGDLPVKLENLLMERVDELGEGPRTVIRIASVVGRRFATSVVKEAGQLNGHFDEFVEKLADEQLIFEEHDSSYNDHIFKHALVQDAVYGTILRSQREEIHRRVGSILESRFSDKGDEIADALAFHFEKGKVPDKAVYYTAKAGRRALKLMSLDEAEERLGKVLKAQESNRGTVSKDILAEVLIDFLHLKCWRYQFAEMLSVAQKHLPALERLGNQRHLSRVLQWQGEALTCAGRFDEAAISLDRALQLGQAAGSDECVMFALWDQMWLCAVRPDDYRNDFIAENGLKVLEYARTVNDYYHFIAAWASLSIDCLERGYVGEAEKWAQTSTAFGHDTGYQPALSFGKSFAAVCRAIQDDFIAAEQLYTSAINHSTSEIEQSYGLAAKGSVLLMQGDFAEARDLLASLRKLAREETFQVLLTAVEIPHAAAVALAGDIEGGLAALEEARVLFSSWRNTRMVTWAHLISGNIYLQLSGMPGVPQDEQKAASGAARRHLEDAIELGLRSGTHGHVAEAYLALGQLLAQDQRWDLAWENFDRARTFSDRLGHTTLSRKIETARSLISN